MVYSMDMMRSGDEDAMVTRKLLFAEVKEKYLSEKSGRPKKC